MQLDNNGGARGARVRRKGAPHPIRVFAPSREVDLGMVNVRMQTRKRIKRDVWWEERESLPPVDLREDVPGCIVVHVRHHACRAEPDIRLTESRGRVRSKRHNQHTYYSNKP